MAWPGYDAYNGQPVMMTGRPGRGRPRGASDHPRQTLYFTDTNGMLAPEAGAGVGRSNSISGGRPAQIVINNSQYDDFSPPHTSRSRRRSHASDYDDDSWDERAHSPHRNRDRSRDPSWHRERSRRRSRSHSRRRHSHAREHESRSPSPYWDLETERKMKKLEELERREAEEAARERAKQEMIIAEAKKAAKKKEEEEFKKRVLEEAEREKYEKELKAKKKKDEEDKMFKARLKQMYLEQGYSEESIEIMIADAERKKGHGGHHSPHGPHSPHGAHSPHAIGHEGAIVKINEQMNVVNLNRPTYIKVHRKHLSPETLDAYDLPWEWDDRDSNFVVIKRWINENDQDKLFEHTRRLREQRLLTNTAVELKKEHGKLKLVREKSPGRERSRSHSRSWIFT
ncbi:MAG: hypothetical protein Q9222_001052 [Ikaeria aurantiellina]